MYGDVRSYTCIVTAVECSTFVFHILLHCTGSTLSTVSQVACTLTCRLLQFC